jgi:hypothetical protein
MPRTKNSGATKEGRRRGRVVTTAVAGAMTAVVALGAQTLGASVVAAASSSSTLHYFQKTVSLKFTNPDNKVIQGYPPVGGHVLENDVDYVGTHSHHAKDWTASDHLFCTVVTAPATADCFAQFAIGSSLIYADNFSVNLASSGLGNVPFVGGPGKYAGDTVKAASTDVPKSNNSDIILTLHKK